MRSQVRCYASDPIQLLPSQLVARPARAAAAVVEGGHTYPRRYVAAASAIHTRTFPWLVPATVSATLLLYYILRD
jgi:hypothetical protein